MSESSIADGSGTRPKVVPQSVLTIMADAGGTPFGVQIAVDGQRIGRIQDFVFAASAEDGVRGACRVVVTPSSDPKQLDLLRRFSWITLEENRLGLPDAHPSFTEHLQVATVASTADKLQMPSPTPAMLDGDQLFDAIYDAICSWDVNVPACYIGYCGANGSHAAMIYASIKRSMGEAVNFGPPTLMEGSAAAIRLRQEDLDASGQTMAKEICDAQAQARSWRQEDPPMAEAIQFAQNWIVTALQYGRNEEYWRARALKAEAKLLGAT